MIKHPLPSASSIRAKWNADAGTRTPAFRSDAERSHMHAWRAATKQDGGGVGVSARSCLGGGGLNGVGGRRGLAVHLAKETAFIILASVGPRPAHPPRPPSAAMTRPAVWWRCVGDGE